LGKSKSKSSRDIGQSSLFCHNFHSNCRFVFKLHQLTPSSPLLVFYSASYYAYISAGPRSLIDFLFVCCRVNFEIFNLDCLFLVCRHNSLTETLSSYVSRSSGQTKKRKRPAYGNSVKDISERVVSVDKNTLTVLNKIHD